MFYREILTETELDTHPLNFAGFHERPLKDGSGVLRLYVYRFTSQEQFEYALRNNLRMRILGATGMHSGQAMVQ